MGHEPERDRRRTRSTSGRRSFCLLVAREGSAGKPVPLLVLRAGRDRIVVVLTGDTDREEIRELVTESYRILAPKKLSALLDYRD
jgi:hypothetical protein